MLHPFPPDYRLLTFDPPVLIIPFTLLWNVRIHTRRKLAFFGLFSLSLVTIAVAIARTADLDATKKSNDMPDSSFLWMWSVIQAALGKPRQEFAFLFHTF